MVGGWLSPSHDAYLQPKAAALGTIGLSAGFRLEVARRALADDTLIAAASWEADQEWFVDFDTVTDALRSTVADGPLMGDALGGLPTPSVFYCCGTDHAERCGLYQGMNVVVVPRAGEQAGAENPARSVFVAEPAAGELAAFSSTKVRAAIAAEDSEYVESALSAAAAAFLLRPSLEEYERFDEDYAQLGVARPDA